NGNRVSLNDSPQVPADPGNRVASDDFFSYDYDPEGNVIRKTELDNGRVITYTWDYRNRLVGVNEPNTANQVGPAFGEIGQVTFAQPNKDTWQTVQLNGSYTHPVVIAQLATSNDKYNLPPNYPAIPATVRIKSVTPNSFQIQLDEWDDQDGVHG